MDVFGVALAAGRDFFRDAVIDAAYELGLLDGAPAHPTPRMRALVDVLVAMGILVRDGDRVRRGGVPPRPVVARAGWGLMADVIRRDAPLPVEGGEIELRYHVHLAQVGAVAARELAQLVGGSHDRGANTGAVDDVAGRGAVHDTAGRGASLLDLGAGAGTYAAAWLDADPDARATVVDYREVIALARVALARFGDRVRFVDGDIRGAALGTHDVVLLANVLHLHDARTCAALVATAAGATKPGGCVVIKDLRVDDGRAGPFEGLAFALNMAIYTGGGDVYETRVLRGWLEAAGLVGIEEHRLPSQPDGIVLRGARPRGALATFEAIAGARPPAGDDRMPRAFRTMLAHADDAATHAHYVEVMPAMRAAQLQHPLFTCALDWARLPRLARVLAIFDVPRAPTLAALYAGTHYGGFMPLLYGYPADLAYFTSRGLDPMSTIDRYLAAPIVHELSHGARDRDALLPPHLDECIAGWYGVQVWPQMAYPDPGEDDAIYAAPWLAQVGQAVARAFGADAVIRAHRGEVAWDVALPKRFVDAATRFGWEDWCRRRTLHFLSDTFDPEPWLALVWDAIVARPDPAFDRQIVGDALRAMCLENALVDGSFRTRVALPGPITLDARACRMSAPLRGVDTVAPRYWLPPAVCANLASQTIALASMDEIERVVDHLCTRTRP